MLYVSRVKEGLQLLPDFFIVRKGQCTDDLEKLAFYELLTKLVTIPQLNINEFITDRYL